MKPSKLSGLMVSVALGAHAVLAQQAPDAPAAPDSAGGSSTNAAPQIPAVAVGTNAEALATTNTSTFANPAPGGATNATNITVVADGAAVPNTAAATTNAPIAAAAPAPPPAVTSPAAPKVELNGDKGLRLNFRGVPLDMVLNYLSETAGFIIVMETEVRGKVDVWSQQAISKDEAVDLLDSILNKNGYAAVRNGRTLTIINRDEAKKRDIPVKVFKPGSDPQTIPKNEQMVTQIIPVRYANATQMIKDLQPLLPTFANLTANESGNALVLTDVQTDIRRMVEIVTALDTSISGISTIKVFPLRFADAKDLVTEIKELFPAPSSSGGGGGRGGNNADPRAMFMQRFGGGPGGGGAGGGGGGTGQSEAKQAASRVTAVADERTNSLVVSAPAEVLDVIEKLVAEIDTNAENITEVRLFHLNSADPTEMADVLTNLFPDDTRSNNSTRSSFQFGGGRFGGPFGGFGGGRGGNSQANSSKRAMQQNKVVAVPDLRTATILVTASSELMPKIEEIIAQLDGNPAQKQKVFVFNLENADVDEVTQVLQDMFQSQNSRNNTRNNQNTNPLTQRQQNQGYGNNSSGFGTGLGSSGSGNRSRLGN